MKMEEVSVQRKFPWQHMVTEFYNTVFLEVRGYGLFISYLQLLVS